VPVRPRPPALDWFSISQIDETTFALSEDGHWEHVHSYLFVGTKRAALIDTGTGIADIRSVVRTLVDLPILVITTHVHWDHIGGHGLFDDRLVHRLDADWLRNGIPQPLESQRASLTLHPFTKTAPPGFSADVWKPYRGEPTRLLEDGDVIDLGDRQLSVVHTPGHSPGHMALHEREREYLVTGDALYKGTLYAFYESTDPIAFARSIDKLCGLDQVTTILPGHNDLCLPRAYLETAQAAFRRIEQQGTLHHGSGVHEFGPISIRL
jgi:glyoxylase-like metal-dependent hydrolase (beta-lactamase superfamily II)